MKDPTFTWELHRTPEVMRLGWTGWQVTIGNPEVGEACWSFDERDGVESPTEAIRRALESKPGRDLASGPRADLQIRVREVRVVISADICPN